ncbi:unnamed protein product [Camellia sinensis]
MSPCRNQRIGLVGQTQSSTSLLPSFHFSLSLSPPTLSPLLLQDQICSSSSITRKTSLLNLRQSTMITIPYLTALTTLFSYGLLFAFGQFRDFFRKIIDWCKASNLQGYAPICLGLEDFYLRRLYLRIQDCFNRPISSAPDAWFDVIERVSNDNNKTLKRTTKISRCLNLGSYNYLGFAAADEYCTPRAIGALKRFSPSTCSSRVDGGTTTLHTKLEEYVASFVGKPAAIVFGMGYVTNSAILPVLVGKGGLIISDSLNHNSIVNGARGSGATIRVFQHNTPSHLERVLREQIADGQPRTHRPWKKIIVVVEGIYSMEGELCKLPEIVAICKKYKAYIYLDEAHSIGAVGKTGRGVCELLGVDTADVDIMMGTFTKSFGSCGGYIAGSKFIHLINVYSDVHGTIASDTSDSCAASMRIIFLISLKVAPLRPVHHGVQTNSLSAHTRERLRTSRLPQDLIQYLKYTCPAHLYATSISPPAAEQIISAIKVLLGEDGSSRGAQKLARIRENSNFFRSELQKMGFEVLGDNDSPVMPIMLYNPAKIPAFSRECLKQNVSLFRLAMVLSRIVKLTGNHRLLLFPGTSDLCWSRVQPFNALGGCTLLWQKPLCAMVAVVTVAFPATPLLLARARICISASHTREDLLKALEVISRVGDLVGIKYFPAEPKKQQLDDGRVKLE